MNRVALRVRQYLKLHMPRRDEQLFEKDGVVTEGCERLAPCRLQGFRKVARVVHLAHALAASARSGLDQHRKPDALRLLEQPASIACGTRITRHGRHTRQLDGALGGNLGAHEPHRGWRWPNEDQLRSGARLGELRVLGEKAVSWVDCLRTSRARRCDDRGNIE